MIPEPPANSHMTHSVVVSQRLLRCLPASIFTRHILLTRCKSIQNHFFYFYSTFSNQNQKPKTTKMCDWHGVIWREKKWQHETGRNEKLPCQEFFCHHWNMRSSGCCQDWPLRTNCSIAVYFKKNTTCHHTPKWKSVSSVDDKQNGVHLYMKINGLHSVLGNQH